MNKSDNQAATPQSYDSWRDLPPIPVSDPFKGSIGNTGDWRTFRPVIDETICLKCGMCYLYCPDGVIIYIEDTVPKIDYTFCKGCGICVEICPKKAMRMVEERI